MEEFIRSYGLWILLAGVFVAMHWFGVGCGSGHRHGSQTESEEAAATPRDKRRVRAERNEEASGSRLRMLRREWVRLGLGTGVLLMGFAILATV
jgi:hypothetical protein